MADEQDTPKSPSGSQPGAEALDAATKARAEAEVDRRLLESSLVRLRATGHPLLRSMADDLLAGRVSMRELARSPEIAAPIQAAARRYLRWRNSMSEAELQAISDDMAARVQWMRDQIALGWKKRDPDKPDTNKPDTNKGGSHKGESHEGEPENGEADNGKEDERGPRSAQ